MRRLTVLLLFLAMPALARELRWDALEVKAHLDAEGRLRVDETQVMVFTGDWNGGERTFDIRPRQSIELHGIERIVDGRPVPLREGSLSEVDHYAWTSRNVLRWRSRATWDPDFDETAITYVLHYTLTNVLRRDGDAFVLDHDFAFPQRSGRIERIAVDLTLDPAWRTSVPQTSWFGGPLSPGESYFAQVPLRYAGSGSPPGLGVPRDVRMLLAALLLLPPTLLGLAFIREALLGRLARVRADDVSRAWLQQNVLSVRPEVIGAMWDGDVGPAEVAALLARLAEEKKISTVVKNGVMHMTLVVPRTDFEGYERTLIDGLFFRDSTTSTSQIRNHYEGTGFNPASEIAAELQAAVNERLPKGKTVTMWKWPLTLLWLASIAALAYAAYRHPELLINAVFTFFGGLFLTVFALIGPEWWRKRKDFGVARALLLLPAFAIVGGVAWQVWRAFNLGLAEWPSEIQLGMTLTALWIFATAVWTMATRGESREGIAVRKMLTAAREYIRRELRKPNPALEDAWYPYVIAFGLDGAMQRWVRAFSASSPRASSSSSSSSTSSSPSSSSFASSSWSGGGGAFGGAGATGTWAAAAATMAAGVASASSSSSSSGGSSSSSGGGGGGSSGGGGGGGW